MPEAKPASSEKHDLEELFAKAVTLLDEVVRNALRRYQRKHTADDVERFKQRLKVLLLKDNLKLLSDVQDSERLKAWLQQVADHLVLRVLKKESRQVGLDDLPPEKLIQSPEQEEIVWKKEQMNLLRKSLKRLTQTERKLFALMWDGMKPDEIAKTLSIKKESVYRQRNALIEKLRRSVRGGDNFSLKFLLLHVSIVMWENE